MNIITFIPARGGSKGIPKKNIIDVAGKPLISWTIDAAVKSSYLEHIYVSTDSQDIADVAKKCGAEVPFLRPDELSTDTSTTLDAALHLINWYKHNIGIKPDYILTLQPTSPLRTTYDIDTAIEIAINNNASAVVSVCEAKDHPYLTMRFTENGEITSFINTDKNFIRRQEMPPAYFINGAIYINKIEDLIKEKTMFPQKTLGYIMPNERSIDIDDYWDLKMANHFLNNIGQDDK